MFWGCILLMFLLGVPMRRLFCLLFFFTWSFANIAMAQSKLVGPVTHVRDGDTIEVLSVPIRLEGLHVPELDSEAGQTAAIFMRDLVQGEDVVCSLTGHRSYDRQIGVCTFGGKDLSEIIIKAGHGRDCPRFSKGRYKKFEQDMVKDWPLPKYCM
ncbi:thermonuclease family protein [Kiloniella laminariae]|uniref:thermonuclease family protein n=1 Tax=Kiloniella laminariae TaxID=454162 RepID=UPI000380F8BE|nr:hypothetical protein [Kiloniella laminariae]